MNRIINGSRISILMVIVIVASLIVHSPSSLAFNEVEDSSPIVQEQTVQIIPGMALVKYKHSSESYPSFGYVQSYTQSSPELEVVHFADEISVEVKMEQLRNDPTVEWVEPVYQTSIARMAAATVTQSVYYNPSDLAYMENWGKVVTHAAYAQQQTTVEEKSSIKVAVIDTGVQINHPDLVDSIIPGFNFLNGFEHTPPTDRYGHGTHVAGVIGANGHGLNDMEGYSGMAPGVKIMPIKVMDDSGFGNSVDLIEGIQHAIEEEVDIINLSLGVYGNSVILHELIKTATNQGIIVVAASGNDSNHWIDGEPAQLNNVGDKIRGMIWTAYPAQYPEVISVGALAQLSDESFALADFSNVGKIDLVAPGVNIYSTYLESNYAVMHGTSMAAPFVSGMFALVKAYNPDLSSSELMMIIKNTAERPTWQSIDSYAYRYPMQKSGEYYDGYMNQSQVYGSGLFDAQKPFEQSRYEIVADTTLFDSSRQVTLQVNNVDLKGNPVISDDDLNVYVSRRREVGGMYNHELISQVQTIALVDGYGEKTVTLPNEDIYHYIIHVDGIEEPSAGSNWIELINQPDKPTASMVSGAYTGQQVVTLSTATPNADIWYSLTVGNQEVIAPYTAPLTLQANSHLYAITVKNQVSSIGAEYSYVITMPPPADTGGGGGGTPPPPPPIALDPTTPRVPIIAFLPKKQELDKSKSGSTLVLIPKLDDLLDQLKATTNQPVIIDATSDEPFDELSVTLSSELLHQAIEMNKSFQIKSDQFHLNIPPQFINSGIEGQFVEFSIKNVSSAAPDLDSAPYVIHSALDFSLKVGNKLRSSFDKPLTVTFLTHGSSPNTDKTYVYYWNVVTNKWEYVGGRITSTGMTAELTHFSRYAVIEMNHQLQDITGHWAERDIDSLVARQIISGVTDQSFEPSRSVTRAEFSVLLAKALRLTTVPGNQFTDIQTSAWYRDGVYAAHHAGIIQGLGPDTFAPLAPLTREQMAVMLLKAYEHITGTTSSDYTATQEMLYTDEGAISSWARPSVRLVSALKLMGGIDNNQFDPKQQTSRAQAAAVIYRLLGTIE